MGLLALGTVLAGGLQTGAAAAETTPTVVTITFDNQWANQMTAAQSLHDHGMAGTFYVISSWIGLPGFMSLSDLQTLESWGNEIGGKTVTNANLTTTSDEEAVRELCIGRNVLMSYGFQVTSFAYPFAEYTAADETLVAECGFNSGRGVGDLVDPTPGGCAYPDCQYAESIPPADPYSIRTPADGEVTTTLADLQNQVIGAEENGGGLLTFSFHQICDTSTPGCDPVYSVSPSLFDAFLTWLQTQEANGVVVKTMHEVIGGTAQSQVSTSWPAAAPIGTNALVNHSLTAADPYASEKPQCWTSTEYGTNSPTYTWSPTGGQDGGGQETITMQNRVSGDAKLVTQLDLGECAPTATTGHSYRVSVYYKSTVPVHFTLYGRSDVGTWSYWTGSPDFPPASTWTLASWLTPAAPSTVTGLSAGLTIDEDGQLSTSNYSMVDVGSGPPPAAPVGVNALNNPLLQTADGSGTNPACWTPSQYGTNSPTYSWSPTGGLIGGQETITMQDRVSGDAKLIIPMDSGNCTPTVTPGVRYQISVYYKSTVPVFLTLYSRDTNGAWNYWTQSPYFPATDTWTLATWTSPVVPSSVDGVSFGMTIDQNGTLSTSNYSLVNTGTS